MAKGIIYVMTTVVPGLVKIGKTGSGNYEQRMYNLERNGYANVVGLKRHFAIEVDDYDDKERLLHEIFSKSNVESTELFALDVDLVVQLLSSFDGKQIYPEDTSKEEVFEQASAKRDISKLPEGIYHMKKKIKRWDNNSVEGVMEYKGGKCTVKAGSVCCPICANEDDTALTGIIAARKTAKIENDVLQEDVAFNSPSMAAMFITYATDNGWMVWKTDKNKPIDAFRK